MAGSYLWDERERELLDHGWFRLPRIDSSPARRYLFGDYCSGRIWSVRLTEGRASGFRREPVTVPGLASFGEDARGELYAVSINRGRVYQLVRR